jgi:hypothetical protein
MYSRLLKISENTLSPSKQINTSIIYISYLSGLTSYSHVDNIGMTASFYWERRFWPQITSLSPLLVIEVHAKLKSSLRKFTVATMTWLNVTEFLYHNWPLICTTCRKHFLVRSSFMTYHWVCKRITTGATSEAETVYHSEAPEFTPVFWGVRV